MALTRTAAVLTTMLRNRADHLVGTFRGDAVLYQYLSDSCRSLVERLVDEHQEMYWASVANAGISADAVSSLAPSDMWKLIMMRVTIDQRRDPIHQADLDEIDREAVSLGGWTAGRWPRFRLVGRSIYWVPVPRADHNVTIYYVPTGIFRTSIDGIINDLTASDDTFDGVFGWDRWVVLDAAIKLLSDEKKDTSVLQREADARMAEIMSAAANRALDEPAKVRDRWDPSDDGSGGRMPPGGFY